MDSTLRFVLLAGVLASRVCVASDTTLADLIKGGSGKAAMQLIERGADVNVPRPDGATPLAIASHMDDAELVARLLKAGAKVNLADEYGETPLTLACVNGNPGIVAQLLAAGADANASRWNGETALMIAARTGNPHVVHMLLEHGARVGAVEKKKSQNALMWAAAEGHAEVVEMLLKAGADGNAVSSAGFTPLIFAAMKGDGPTVANLLSGGVAIDYAIPGGSTALLVAVTARKTEAVSVLLARGADVKKADSAGNTPVHIAAQVGPLTNVQALIARGADLNARNNSSRNTSVRAFAGRRVSVTGEQTPLMLAARANQVELMRALVAAGADPKLRAEDGSGLLMAAAASGHVEAVQYAISLDPDVKAVTANKESVIHAAMRSTVAASTESEICKVVQFLADRGAEVDAPDVNGTTPLMLAREVPLNQPAELLVKLIRAGGAEPRESKQGAKADGAQ